MSPTTPDLAQLRAERLAALAHELTSEVGDMLFEKLAREPLGAGLARVWGMYVYRESPSAPVEDLGLIEAYELELGDEPLALEIDAGVANDVRRRVHLTWPGRDVVDATYRAAELAQLGRLLSRPEVLAALERWADEDAAGERQEGGQA